MEDATLLNLLRVLEILVPQFVSKPNLLIEGMFEYLWVPQGEWWMNTYSESSQGAVKKIQTQNLQNLYSQCFITAQKLIYWFFTTYFGT